MRWRCIAIQTILEQFEANLADLDFNDNVRWHDLKGTENARPAITDRDFVVATVAPPTKALERRRTREQWLRCLARRPPPPRQHPRRAGARPRSPVVAAHPRARQEG